MRHILTMLWQVVVCVTLCSNSLLSAQGARDLVGIAMQEPILKELGIEKDSPLFAELYKLSDAQSKEIAKLISQGRDQGQKDVFEALQRAQQFVYPNYRPELQKLLAPNQFTRLQQLSWQQMGSGALLDDDLSKALNITQEQWEKLVVVRTELGINTRNLYKDREPFTPEKGEILLKKTGELNQIWRQKSNDILSPEQQEKFFTLLGKPFDSKLYYAGKRPSAENILAIEGLAGLSLMEPVLKELGIPQDSAVVTELQKLGKYKRLELAQQFQSTLPEERASDSYAERIVKVEAKYNTELQGILSAEQYLRVRQIRLQLWGMKALSKPEIVKTLDLTIEQQRNLSNVTFPYMVKEQELLRPNNIPLPNPSKEVREKVRELKLIELEKAIQSLNSEQRDKYAELRGKPFDLTLLEPASAP